MGVDVKRNQDHVQKKKKDGVNIQMINPAKDTASILQFG